MKSYSIQITAIHGSTVWYLDSWHDNALEHDSESPAPKKKTFASAAVALAWIKVAPKIMSGFRWGCDGSKRCYCEECQADRAAESLVELEQLNTALRRAMRRAGILENILITRWSEQEAWMDLSGYQVSASNDKIAERAAKWLKAKLEQLGKQGGFSNDWGQSAKRAIELRYFKADIAGTAHVITHSHMISD